MDYSPGVVDSGAVQTELEAISRAIVTPSGLFELTPGEESANLRPINYRYAPGDVRRYGGKVDNTSDDSSPLQAALLSGSNATVPPGTLKFSGTMELTTRNRLFGAGAGRSVLSYTGSAQAFVNSTPGTRIFDVGFRGFTLTDAGTGTIGLDLDSVSSIEMHNVQINSFGTGIRINSPTSGYSIYGRYYDVTTSVCTIGYDLDGLSTNAHVFMACRSNQNTTGWKIEDSNDNSLIACQIEGGTTGVNLSATGAGLHIHSSISLCRFEGVTNNIVVGTNVTEANILANYHVNGVAITDSGLRTNSWMPYGNLVAQKMATAYAGASGVAYTFERTASGGSNVPAVAILDSATTSGTPTTLQLETGRSTGLSLNILNGIAGSAVFGVQTNGRIRTNQSASNTNTPGGATAYQLPIYDAAGTLLGYIPIYGSAW